MVSQVELGVLYFHVPPHRATLCVFWVGQGSVGTPLTPVEAEDAGVEAKEKEY